MPAIVQLPPEFLSDFLAQAAGAHHRVWLQSMTFEVGEMMEELVPVLKTKALEGVDVCLEIDWVSQRFVHGHLPLLPPLNSEQRAYNRQLHQANLAARDELLKVGTKIVPVNQAGIISWFLPMFRRNHVKLFVIDEQYAWLGGVNLLDRAFSCQDFMVRYDQPTEIEMLSRQFVRVNNKRAHHNEAIVLNATDTLLVDVGNIGRSIIYNQALVMIDEATTSIKFVSQFVPEGLVRQALLRASQRGVRVQIVTSYIYARKRWSTAHKAAYKVFVRNLDHYPNLTFRHSRDRVHAKLLIVDDTQALFGSHNLVDTGVLMGTEELAVRSHNPQLVKQLVTFYLSLS